MSIRKVSDLPEFEEEYAKGMDEFNLYGSKVEVSLMSGSGYPYTYASRCMSLGNLCALMVDAVHRCISSEYVIKPADDDTLGGVKTGFTTSEGSYSRNYAVSADSDHRIFVSIPKQDCISRIDNLRANDQGSLTLNALSNVVFDGYYLSASGRLNSVNSDISVDINPHRYPQFGNLTALTSRTQYVDGIVATLSDLFVYVEMTDTEDGSVSCQMSYDEGTDMKWCNVMVIPLASNTVCGQSFELERGHQFRV